MESGGIYVYDDVAGVLVVFFEGLDGGVDGFLAGFEGSVTGEGDADGGCRQRRSGANGQ